MISLVNVLMASLATFLVSVLMSSLVIVLVLS
jgi:hypothetical protein